MIRRRHNCKVLGCLTPSRGPDRPEIHHFSFPIQDIERCKKWIEFCNNPKLYDIPWQTLRQRYICYIHFPKDKMTFGNNRKVRLFPNIVPTLNPPGTVVNREEKATVQDIYNAYHQKREIIKKLDGNTTYKTISAVSVYNKYKSMDPRTALQSNLPALPTTIVGLNSKEAIVEAKVTKKTAVTEETAMAEEPTVPSLTNSFNVILNPNNDPTSRILYLPYLTTCDANSELKEKQQNNCASALTPSIPVLNLNESNEVPEIIENIENHPALKEGIAVISLEDTIRGNDASPEMMSDNESLSQDFDEAEIYNNTIDADHGMMQLLKHTVDRLDTSCKTCLLMFKESHIREEFHYDTLEDRVEGFVDFGPYGRQNLAANRVLIFMVKGLFSNWKQPFSCYFFKNTVPVDILSKLISDMVNKLISIGLTPAAVICEPRIPNVMALAHLTKTTIGCEKPYFQMHNKKIYIFYDAPSLLKTTLNHFFYCDIETDVSGVLGVAKWEHFVNFYEADLRLFKVAHELTQAHMNPVKGNNLRMAEQVFSRTVYATMAYFVIGKVLPPESIDTSTFIQFINSLYESFTGSRVRPCDRKVLLCCLSKSSAHHEFWKAAAPKVSSLKFVSKSTPRTLRPHCRNCWTHNIKAISMFWKDLKAQRCTRLNMQSLTLNRLRHFSNLIRKQNRWKKGPTCAEFVSALMSSLVSKHLGRFNPITDDKEALSVSVDNTDEENADNKNQENVCNMDEENVEKRKKEKECFPTADEASAYLNWSFEEQDIYQAAQKPKYVAEYIVKEIMPPKFCQRCCKTLLSAKEKRNRVLVLQKQYVVKKSLFIPSPKLIKFINDTSFAMMKSSWRILHRSNVKENLKNTGFRKMRKEVLGCERHSTHILAFLLEFISRLVIFARCRRLNRLVSKKYRRTCSSRNEPSENM